MAEFNLLDEPWIPVLTLDGEHTELGIRQIFRRAEHLSGIAADLPTVSVAIQRSLQAIALRTNTTLPAATEDRVELWGKWWSQGLPLDAIEAYLTRWEDRFYLFHEQFPFFQVPGIQLASGAGSGLVKIMADVPAGTKHFVTRSGPGIQRLTFAEAARWLVHAQAFDCAGIKSGVVGDARVKGGKSYSFGYPAFAGTLGIVSLESATLAQTLLLNLHLGATSTTDAPPWETAPQRVASDAIYPSPRGAAQAWTWPSRMIRLIREGDHVTDAVVSNGERLAPQNQFSNEPMTAWRHSPTQTKKEKTDIYMPVGHQAEQAAWRGLPGILGLSPTGEDGRPARPAGVLEWLAEVQDAGLVDSSMPVSVRCVAMTYGPQASTFAADYNDVVSSTVVALATKRLRQLAVDAVQDARLGIRELREFARNVALASGDSGDGVSDRNRHVEATGFGMLRPQFEEWITTLSSDTDRDEARARWQRKVSTTLRRVADEHAQLAPSAAVFGRRVKLRDRAIHMDLGQAGLWFRSGLSKALPMAYPHLENKEVNNVVTPTTD